MVVRCRVRLNALGSLDMIPCLYRSTEAAQKPASRIEGKVYIDDVFTIWNGERSGDFGKSNYCDKWFMLLSVAIRGGLFHPNCRHTMGQYIEGLTKIPQPIPAEKIREQRELEEKQRAMERKIRALKRKVEGTQDEKKVKEYKRKLP